MSDTVIVAIIAAGMVLLFEVFYFGGKALQTCMRTRHEIKLLELEFSHKLEWEREQRNRLKEAQDYRKTIEEYVDKQISDQKPNLDMDRVALLYLVLSGADGKVSTDNVKAEIDKVKGSFEFIKQYLK